MAIWTTPKTWNVGDILTAADMNTYVRDNTSLLVNGLYRKTTTKDNVNSGATVDLLNGEITIGANVMGASGVLRATLICDYLNNTGSGATETVSLRFGTTQLWTAVIGGGGGVGTGAGRRPLVITFTIHNLGATNAQQAGGTFNLGTPTAPAVGLGDLSLPPASETQAWTTPFSGTSAEDTTSAKALVLNWTHSVVNAAISTRLLAALIEVA